MIFILKGDIRTGKTTALTNWVKERSDVDGLLCPDDKNGMRYFLKVHSKTEFNLEVTVDSEPIKEEVLQIGNFKFLKSAFEEANQFLKSLAIDYTERFLVIDELGKLELKNLGLHEGATVLIPKVMNNATQHLILVVRASLIENIIKHYNIVEYTLISKNDLTKKSFA